MPEPQTADPRLAQIDFALLDLDLFPPIEDWDDDDWDEAVLITSTHQTAEAMRTGDLPSRPWSEVRAELRLED